MVEYHLYPVPRLFALQGHGFTSSPGPTWEERVPTSGSLDHVRIMWRKGVRKWRNGHRMDLPRNAQFEVHRVDRLAESNGQLCAMQGSLGVKTKSLENQGQSIS